ncbi:rad2 superfamily protein mus201 [Brevipalpus obovatus]|uniref:rad2 superfamily protein mus201 n=1 Tax=Brevipalpus obovatus TaxID=246614 RepID=UPI003D9EB000
MGVKGLWALLEPIGLPVNLESLEGKVVAVDISIWLNQSIKGIRDKRGILAENSHILGLFNRICKLLHFKIKPVFVFDGGVPALKRQTIEERRLRRENAQDKVKGSVNKVLKTYLQDKLQSTVDVDEVDIFVNDEIGLGLSKWNSKEQNALFILPDDSSNQSSVKTKNDDSDSDNEGNHWESVSRPFNPNLDDYDPAMIDTESEDFKNLPPEIRHEVLSELRDKKKKWNKVDSIPTEREEFTNYQMNRVLVRRKIQAKMEEAEGEMVQKVSETAGKSFGDDDYVGLTAQRVMSDETTHFVLLNKRKTNDQQRQVAESKLLKPFEKKDKDVNRSSAPCTRLEDMYGQVGEFDFGVNDEIKKEGATSLKDRLKLEQTESKLYVPRASYESNTRIEKLPSKGIQSDEESSSSESFQEVEDAEIVDDKVVNIVLPPTNVENESKGSKTFSDIIVDDDLIAECLKPFTEDEMSFSENIKDNVSEKKSSPPPKNEPIPSCSKDFDCVILDDDLNMEDSKSKSEVSPKSSKKRPISESPPVNSHTSSVTVSEKSHSRDFTAIKSGPSPTRSVSNQKFERSVKSPKLSTLDASPRKSSPEVIMLESEEKEDVNDKLMKTPTKSETNPNSSSLSQSPRTPPRSTIGQNKAQSSPRTPTKTPPPSPFKQPYASPRAKVPISPSKSLSLSPLKIGADPDTSFGREVQRVNLEAKKVERQTSTVAYNMIADCRELLSLFGIPYVMSPMEAEAQCAALELQGLTEGTITDDSDVWLFGGKTVYKNFFNQSKYVEMYRLSDIESKLKLNRDLMICLSLLTGCDYTDGVEGVGCIKAVEILGEFKGEGIERLKCFKQWWNEKRHGKDRSPGTKRRAAFLKLNLSESFPSEVVYNAFINPTVLDSNERFSWGMPDLDLLRDYAAQKMKWSKEKIDGLLVPIIKKLNQKQSQLRIDQFIKVRSNTNKLFYTSKRLADAVNKISESPGGTTAGIEALDNQDKLPVSDLRRKVQNQRRQKGSPEKAKKKPVKKAAPRKKGAKKNLKSVVELSESSSGDD